MAPVRTMKTFGRHWRHILHSGSLAKIPPAHVPTSIRMPKPISPSPSLPILQQFEQKLWSAEVGCAEQTVPVRKIPKRRRAYSARPVFPDTRGLQLYPLQTVCAYAYCARRRLKPSLYCGQHACQAENCEGAIFLHNSLNLTFDRSVPFFECSILEEPVARQSITINDMYCFRHVCQVSACSMQERAS